MTSDDSRPNDRLATLQHVLASAVHVTKDLIGDPFLMRLTDVFARMPLDDRETILAVLEREVDLRNMSREGHGPLSGHKLTKPNPNARLYLRVNETDPAPSFSPEEVVQAVNRAARVMHGAFQRARETRDLWAPSIVQGLRTLRPDERASLRSMHETIIGFIDEAERPSH